RPGDGADHPFRRALGCLQQAAFAPSRLDSSSGERALEFAISRWISDGGKARAKFTREGGERGRVLVGAHRLDAKPFALTLEQSGGPPPDGPGGAKERPRPPRRRRIARSAQNPRLHDPPSQRPAAGALEPPARQSDDPRRDAGGHEAVEAVHQPAVSGNEM